ncbi:hypothetical protein PFISCL1PPCAC_10977, partial [Pristionchus fissidentatus]
GLDRLQAQSSANAVAASPQLFETLKNDTRKVSLYFFVFLLTSNISTVQLFEKRQANAVQAKALAVSQELTNSVEKMGRDNEKLMEENGKMREENGEMKRRLEES